MTTPDREARFWDRAARGYARSAIGDVAGYERTLARTRFYLKPEHTAVEFGCGTGSTALKLAPAVGRYRATDISSEMIAIAREKAEAEGAANLTFDVATIEAEQPDGGFDVALGFNILHLVPDRAALLKGVHRVLKPGGFFITKTPCLKEMNPLVRLIVPVMQAIGQAPYVGTFSAGELEREIAAAGFEIIERDRHGSKRKQEPRIFIAARKL